MLLVAAIATGAGLAILSLIDGAANNPTKMRLQEELDKLRSGKTASVAAKHILGTFRDEYKKHPELFAFSEPQQLVIEETGELVWSITLKRWARARDKHENYDYPEYTEIALFHDTKGTVRIYKY